MNDPLGDCHHVVISARALRKDAVLKCLLTPDAGLREKPRQKYAPEGQTGAGQKVRAQGILDSYSDYLAIGLEFLAL